MSFDRRCVLLALGALGAHGIPMRVAAPAASRRIDLIEAPSNLGLRPPARGAQPGTWRAPEVLREPLSRRLGFRRTVALPRPRYQADAEAGTRVRNGQVLKRFGELIAVEVERSLREHAWPLVVGGDCSNLLGCLAGLRRGGGRGLIHVDGHSDFFHPGNYDTRSRLGSAAGMDLALATGRGEPLLTTWPRVSGALAADEDTVQIGERNAGDPSYAYRDIERTQILRLTVQSVRKEGIDASVRQVVARLRQRAIERAWLHLDLDVLDQAVMPAVDAPGTPGFDFAELSALLARLIDSGRIAGLDVAIYDPTLDPHGRYVEPIARAVADGLR